MDIEKAVRVNARISKSSNDWLDRKALETGVNKSALISLAVESYIKENEVIHVLPKILNALDKHGIKLDDI